MSTTTLYETSPETGTVSTTNLTSLYSNTSNFTSGVVNSSVFSVNGGTGVTVNPTTGNVVVSIGQAVATSSNVTFANFTATGNLSNNYFTLTNSIGTNGQVLITNGAGATSWTTISSLGVVTSVSGSGAGISVSPTTGAVIVSNTGVTSIIGTANQVIASSSTGAITLSTPQNIATTSSPTFAGATLGNITVGVATDNTITTTTGNLILTSPTTLIDASNDVIAVTALVVDGYSSITGEELTTTSTATVPLISSTRNAFDALVTIFRGTDSHVVKVLVLRTTAGAMLTTYGEMYDNTALATFTADINPSAPYEIRLLVTPTSATSTVFKSVRTALN